MDLMNDPAKVEVRSFSLPVPEIIAAWYFKNFGQSLDTPFKVAQGR